MYQRPPYPNTWARMEGKGRVWYTALGHREDVWTNPVFQQILVGGVKWALGEVSADVTPNLKTVAPGAFTNPHYVEPKPAPGKEFKFALNGEPNTLTAQEKADGWKLLWDGKTTDGWHSPKGDEFPTKSWSPGKW